ncbi:GNAT family N-acetyltransferase [Pleionea sp. CnH1-48]|uniref:GNAT family N-acetyltransferase n=1 Tax=Pleionea sp. CnH1-48 TaxID=2954494 RepID=UPI002096D0D0|nr:GNAT family N-acetyltransferase [Pleionea sp. CnH1-48]MCO7226135.1 GNAT family N-acetyltransferase [Pleionea sp. CnH1-48]
MAVAVAQSSLSHIEWILASERQRWLQALHPLTTGPGFCPDYLSALYSDIALIKYSDDQSYWVCPVLERSYQGHKDWYSPYGWSGLCGYGLDNALSQFNDYAIEQNSVCSYLVQGPESEPFNEASDHYRTIYKVTLSSKVDEMFAQLSKTSRYEVRKWEQMNLLVCDNKRKALPELLQLYRHNLEQKQAGHIYFHILESLKRLIELDTTWVFCIWENNKLVAANVFIVANNRADYFVASFSEEGKTHSRGLLWHGMCELAKRGIVSLNLGGGISEDDGLARFKKSMGGTEVRCNVLKQVHNQPVFDKLCSKAKPSQFFPPYYSGSS